MAAFLKNLFTPKWQHSDAAVRLAAIDANTEVQIINTLAVKDSDQEVRLKAIGLLQDTASLVNLLGDKNSFIKQAATQQYLTITLGSADSQQQLSKIAQVNDTQLLMTIATMMGNNELAQAALANIEDEQQLVNFIKQSASAKARLLAMEKIKQPALLKAIEKQFKNKDKALTRLAKNKLIASHEKEQELQLAITHTNNLLANAQQLAEANFKPTFLAELTYLKQAWLKVDSSESQQAEFAIAIDACDKTLLDNQQLQADLLAQQQNTQDAQNQHKQALDQLHQLFESCKSGDKSHETDLATNLKEISLAWQQASDLNKADGVSQKEFDTLLAPMLNLQSSLNTLNNAHQADEKEAHDFSGHLKQLKSCESLLKKINWPSEFPAGKQLHALEAKLALKRAAVDEHKANEKQTLGTLNTLLGQLESNIEDGQLKSAKQQEAKIRKLIKQLPPQQDKSLTNLFQHLSSQLNELKDWQGFAAAPKFESLCVEMENLITAQIDAKQLSHNIHNLQDQWKALGGLPDKQQHQALWTRFKKAADTAYEPCKQYYQDLSKVKQYNQAQKEEICQQLEIFFEKNDWESADWKAIQGLLDHANSEFRKYSPVENSAHKALQSRFQQASKHIHGKVIGFYQDNAQQKQTIIDKIIALQEQDDLSSAIEECKKQQQNWKAIGPAGRQEHSLWKTFREQCDALFNRRTAENQAHKQQQNEERNKANALVEQANSLLELTSNDGLQQLATLKQSLQQLEMAPSFMEQKNHQLNKIEEQIQQQRRERKVQAQQQLWVNAMDLSQQLAQWELTQQGDQQALTASIQEAELPKGAADALLLRLNDKKPHNNDDYLRLCLELEITRDVASPSSDQAARMALQVQRLQKNMGKKLPEQFKQIESLQLEWFALSANTEQYLEFATRFNATLTKAN
ncbi:hypothetical protein A9Q73_00240 [Bermanella sp. 47_1433_sub80_T6]|nr:hypothetical protein A9Q73_00240 [Bermanella sp. 47_1433_sub80_T6]